jgi:hypothetical protein
VVLSEQVQQELGIIYAPGETVKMQFSKADLEKIRDGIPLKGPGSKKGRGLAGKNGGPSKGSKQKRPKVSAGAKIEDGVNDEGGSEEPDEDDDPESNEDDPLPKTVKVGDSGFILIDGNPTGKRSKARAPKTKGKDVVKVVEEEPAEAMEVDEEEPLREVGEYE